MPLSSSYHKISISKLEKADVKEVARLLVDAFSNEELTKFVHNKKKDKYNKIFSLLGELKLNLFLETSQICLVAKRSEKIVGCVVLKTNDISFFQKVKTFFPKSIFFIIPFIKSVNFKNAIIASKLIKIQKDLEKPYYTLEMIGVDSEYRGKGIGKILLSSVDEAMLENQDIIGVYLFTADKKSKAIYENKGYELIEKNQSENISVYHMFKKVRGVI